MELQLEQALSCKPFLFCASSPALAQLRLHLLSDQLQSCWPHFHEEQMFEMIFFVCMIDPICLEIMNPV